MEIQKSNGIVLRLFRWTGSKNIATLLTEEAGIVKCIVRPRRVRNGMFLGLVDILQHGIFIIEKKENRELQYLKEYELLDDYIGLTSAFSSYSVATVMLEIVEKFFKEEEGSKQFYLLVKEMLQRLLNSKNAENFLIKFLLGVTRLLGFDFMSNYSKISDSEKERNCIEVINSYSLDNIDKISISKNVRKRVIYYLLNHLKTYSGYQPRLKSISFLE